MDRRQKFILLSIASLLLLGSVLWFFVWPLLKPVLPDMISAQPPAVAEPNAPNTNVGSTPETDVQQAGSTDPFTINASDNPDAQRIVELSRRASVLSERIESGSSENAFSNYTDAILNVDSDLANALRAKQKSLQTEHPKDGPLYVTIARSLVNIPEDAYVILNDTFFVRIQMQVQTQTGSEKAISYLESKVTFERRESEWIVSNYEVAPFKPE